MNDNNDFVTFVFMVLFENHRLMFGSFGVVLVLRVSGQIPETKTAPLILI